MVAWLVEVTQSLDKPCREREGRKEGEEWREVIDGRREGSKEMEGGREGRRKGGKKGEREEGRKGGREGGRDGGMEGGEEEIVSGLPWLYHTLPRTG